MQRRIVAKDLKFPEGPAFDRAGNLFVVEILGGQISRIDVHGEISVFARPGGGLTCGPGALAAETIG